MRPAPGTESLGARIPCQQREPRFVDRYRFHFFNFAIRLVDLVRSRARGVDLARRSAQVAQNEIQLVTSRIDVSQRHHETRIVILGAEMEYDLRIADAGHVLARNPGRLDAGRRQVLSFLIGSTASRREHGSYTRQTYRIDPSAEAIAA